MRNDLDKSIIESLDGSDDRLLPHIPYILQDLWEIGADPAAMVSLIRDNIFKNDLKILDLGCGKGAISVNIAKELKLKVKGIDALPIFIGEAVKYAQKHQVNHLCEFEAGDIRSEINNLKGYDIVILGAIGPVLGNLRQTLQSIKRSLNTKGYVLLDDGYLDDEYTGNYDRCLRKSEFYHHIDSAGFKIVKEIIMVKNQIQNS
ncbi:MAG: methyltransferase domain-containing protein [Bacteroidales bacterium]|nr:methyltransferase domain-containing protein [Bacteroidales bacterium]